MPPLRLTDSPQAFTPVNRTVTQEDINRDDEERRKEALRDLMESWMDRLQLISVITTFFVSIEASLLTITTPSDTSSAGPIVFQLCNISLMGALLVHTSAAIISFLAAFFLIRHKLKVARQEEIEALIQHQENSEDSSGNKSTERKEVDLVSHTNPRPVSPHRVPPSQARPTDQVRFVAPRSTDPIPGPIRIPSGLNSADGRPLFSTNPHLVQVGPFSRMQPPTLLLSHFHSLSIVLSLLGFVLALLGMLLFSWSRLPLSVSASSTVVFGMCAMLSITTVFMPGHDGDKEDPHIYATDNPKKGVKSPLKRVTIV
ncbi:hypothetical protein BJ165DRAFT_1524592 [Panaeolus papilionaceus]|nr:hypothetical protein BJ165DRAFT_1524592 [Panaeolus papilionaceus]